MIKVYTVPACGRCQVVKDHLDRAGLEFQEIDVAGNFAGLREMIRISGSRQVPVTVTGTDFVVGPDLAALTRLISARPNTTEENQ